MTKSRTYDIASTIVIAVLFIILVLFVAEIFKGSDIGLHLPHAPANGWLCYDNDPRLEPHASPDGNDHVCSDAEMRQFYDQSPAPSPLPR